MNEISFYVKVKRGFGEDILSLLINLDRIFKMPDEFYIKIHPAHFNFRSERVGIFPF